MVLRALAAAERLAQDGIDAEVVDLRSLRPIDFATIAASVRKTGRLVIVYEGVKTMGIGAEIAALVAEDEVFHALVAPIVRLGGADSPIPYNPVLEKATVPQENDIVVWRHGSSSVKGGADVGHRGHPPQGRHGHGVRRNLGLEGGRGRLRERRATSFSRWRPTRR